MWENFVAFDCTEVLNIFISQVVLGKETYVMFINNHIYIVTMAWVGSERVNVFVIIELYE